MKVATLFLSLLVGCSSIQASAQATEKNEASPGGAAESLSTAKQAVRCSIIYGMAGGASKNESARTELLGLQKTMMLAAPKLGATRDLMEEWLVEFDREMKSTRHASSFWSEQIEICTSFFDSRGDELSKLVDHAK